MALNMKKASYTRNCWRNKKAASAHMPSYEHACYVSHFFFFSVFFSRSCKPIVIQCLFKFLFVLPTQLGLYGIIPLGQVTAHVNANGFVQNKKLYNKKKTAAHTHSQTYK